MGNLTLRLQKIASTNQEIIVNADVSQIDMASPDPSQKVMVRRQFKGNAFRVFAAGTSRSVLGLGQLSRQVRNMVVIYQRQGSDNGFVGIDDLRQQSISNQVANRLAPILIPALRNKPVKLLEQVFFQRNPSADQLRHSDSPQRL
jgi:sensor histidine kinase regulating citrate/malate metabolism